MFLSAAQDELQEATSYQTLCRARRVPKCRHARVAAFAVRGLQYLDPKRKHKLSRVGTVSVSTLSARVALSVLTRRGTSLPFPGEPSKFVTHRECGR